MIAQRVQRSFKAGILAVHLVNHRQTWKLSLVCISPGQFCAHFYASDLTALPYMDGVSLRRGTLMAALAHGRTIVTTHPQTTAPELDGVVETAAPNDPDDLAESILTVWHDPDYRRVLEQAAQEAAQHFTWTRIAERTIEFFESIRRRQDRR